MARKTNLLSLLINQTALIVFINVPIIVFFTIVFENRTTIELTVRNFTVVWIILFFLFYGAINLFIYLKDKRKKTEDELTRANAMMAELQNNYQAKLKELEALSTTDFNTASIRSMHENYRKEQEARFKELQNKYRKFEIEYKDKLDKEYALKIANQQQFRSSVEELLADKNVLSSIAVIHSEFTRLNSFLNNYSTADLIFPESFRNFFQQKLLLAKQNIFLNAGGSCITVDLLNCIPPQVPLQFYAAEPFLFSNLDSIVQTVHNSNTEIICPVHIGFECLSIDNSDLYIPRLNGEKWTVLHIAGFTIVKDFLKTVSNNDNRKYVIGQETGRPVQVDPDKQTIHLHSGKTLYYSTPAVNVNPKQQYCFIYDISSGYILTFFPAGSDTADKGNDFKDGLPF